MIRTIIIDDEPLACMLLKDMLQHRTDIDVIEECYDGYTGLKRIQESKPDLIFLDIQMPKITGLEMLELIDHPPKVIFTTAYDEYAVKAFDINAVDYLLKPYSKERLDQAINRIVNNEHAIPNYQDLAAESMKESISRIVVKVGNMIKIIPLEDVLFLEAAADYIKVTTQERYYLKHSTMQHFEGILPSDKYIRVHRSFIVQLHYINKLIQTETGSYQIELKNHTLIPVSKAGYKKLKQYLN